MHTCFILSQLQYNSRLVRDKQTLDVIEKTAVSSINMVVVSLLHKVSILKI